MASQEKMKCEKGYEKKGNKCVKLKKKTQDTIHYTETIYKENSGGVGFLGALTLIFIVLKLLGKISWSWWWVLSPTLIPIALGLVFLIIIMFFIRREF